jgi:hypothetical protein
MMFLINVTLKKVYRRVIMYKCATILAAGEGKRMKSETPKVLHKVCGKEMVNITVITTSVRSNSVTGNTQLQVGRISSIPLPVYRISIILMWLRIPRDSHI